MRATLVTIAILATGFAIPVAAQQSQPAGGKGQMPPSAEQAVNPQLQAAEQQVRQATDRLQRLPPGADQQAIDQASEEARQALQGARQAVGQLPESDRAELQRQVNSAEQALQRRNPAMLQAMENLQRAMIASAAMKAAANEQNPNGLTHREMVGNTLYGADGRELGEIHRVVVGRHGEPPAAVITIARIMGPGEQEVAIPLARIWIAQPVRLVTPMTAETISDMAPYDSSAYDQADQNEIR
jgi:hypothetical protein